MPQVAVNLLKHRHILSEKDYAREHSALRSSVLGLIVVIVVTIALAIWNFVLSSRLSGIERSITEATKQTQGLSQASASQVYLKSRLTLITTFLDQRLILNESLERIFSLSIPGAAITSASFADEQTLSVLVTSANAVVLNEVLSYYQSDTSFFTQVVSRGISRGKDGTYSLQLDLTIPKEGGKTNG